MASVYLKPERVKPVVQRHPWVFSGAIARIEGQPSDGEIVDVRDPHGAWLARGYINRRSQIVVRLLTWDEHETIDTAFWQHRLAQAISARPALVGEAANAYRLVHGESDFLPGLIVDRYGEWLSVQFLTLGIEQWRETIVATLVELLRPAGIWERSDVEVRSKEGLPERAGRVWGREPPETLEIREHNHRFLVDLRRGQKTGFYLDQRENRARLPAFCQGAEVLDAFCYTGAFAVYAAAGGATRLTLLDSSGPALRLARRNLALNGYERLKAEYVEGDVFTVLRRYRTEGRRFDVIILDPPKLAASAQDVQRAARAYKDINLLAFQLLRPGGWLFTFSCSGAVSADLFQKIVFAAATDAQRDAQIVGYMAQSADHPVALSHPEGAYLKGLLCRVVGP